MVVGYANGPAIGLCKQVTRLVPLWALGCNKLWKPKGDQKEGCSTQIVLKHTREPYLDREPQTFVHQGTRPGPTLPEKQRWVLSAGHWRPGAGAALPCRRLYCALVTSGWWVFLFCREDSFTQLSKANRPFDLSVFPFGPF